MRNALRPEAACEGDEDEPVQDRDARERDEPDARRDRERHVTHRERDHAADDGEWHVHEDEAPPCAPSGTPARAGMR